MIRPGPRNLITDVDGILVGNAEDPAVRSGTTVVLAERACAASVDVRGGAPGTRDTDLLDPTCRVQAIDAVFLSGGSAFGLSAGDGVMKWLRERGRGVPVGTANVPIAPGAILFDLLNGGDKDWDWPPYRELGYRATGAAAKSFALGNSGAGLGARCGHLKGGLGSASAVDPATGLQVGAIVAVNAVGFATMGDLPHFWAWALEQDDEFGGLPPPPRGLNLAVSHTRQLLDHDAAGRAAAGQHHHRRGGDQRAARQGVVPAPGDHGPGRAGARAAPGAHAGRWRRGLRPGHRPRGRRRRPDRARRVGHPGGRLPGPRRGPRCSQRNDLGRRAGLEGRVQPLTRLLWIAMVDAHRWRDL
jgi:hypothetical protein